VPSVFEVRLYYLRFFYTQKSKHQKTTTMKNIIILLLLAFTVTFSFGQESKWPKVDPSNLDAEYYPANAAWRNYLKGEARNTAPKIKVLYSRPLKNEREIFGALVPYDKEWRLGANEATEITFYQSVGIGGKTVTPGTYTMFATPKASEWTISFSSQLGIWGSENRDVSKTVASITVPVAKKEDSVEALSIAFREIDEQTAHMSIQWDYTRVEVPIAFNPVIFSGADVSPMDKAHFPAKSAYTNYLKGEEANIQPKVQVVYSRPYKKGRKVFGELLKVGDTWRVGANQSTEITFFQDTKVGDLDLQKGKYVLYAKVMDGNWDLIFSKDFPAWGANNRDESKDVGTTNVKLTSESEVLENLSIIFEEKDADNAVMIIGWDTTRAEVPMKFKG